MIPPRPAHAGPGAPPVARRRSRCGTRPAHCPIRKPKRRSRTVCASPGQNGCHVLPAEASGHLVRLLVSAWNDLPHPGAYPTAMIRPVAITCESAGVLGWKVGSATGGGRDRTGVTGRSRGAGRSPRGCTPVPARSCPPVNSRSSPAGEHLQQLPAGGYRSMNSSVEIGRYCDDDKGRGGCAARRGRNAHPSRLPDAPGPDDDATGTGVSISRLPGHWSSIRGHNLVPDRGREHS